ncbi:uncharacterized protein LOC122863370 isoform X1 [Siniperca chuatsi]|uniref:uncharacterized protein LOC122863370 isoform X1 n=1 Tax=Siniperca chuatsi TaxID=119488 RepID=UPI001CE037FE|nr:uncharacterized protein LOC122863370 isoform X1 [Siniperca chuatsi]XP_044025730.1 uncharacterized protein LOC122863370 isoform X1 [Siniperca chuatsi]XP_044025731.1 uncharacterized protein LOC122863370 isoform X1 [Siniperca chuatsi]XP_044025732.1 uncharacterized protein LOC122863370 isoform X1 [Siniperca chuatsi]
MRKGRHRGLRRKTLKMDNKDTCNLKAKKMMDANTVWQWRIMRVKKYSRRPEPFHYSNKIGLDFNAASNTQEKLDLQLVTNGVILEVCDFAKTVNKSKRYFITNILENNFDLGLENEQQRIDFTARILHKVTDLIRKPPKDKQEVFTLFDTSSKPEFNSNNGLNMASPERKTESFLVEMDDTDDSDYEDEFKCSQATCKEDIKTESLSEEMDGAHVDGSENEDELKCTGITQSTAELKEDVLPPSFPYCEEIGLSLEFGSKQSLDPGLLTKGVMIELVHFTRILTASFSSIVLGVLEHNFELDDLKSLRVKNRIWFKISHLLKRRKRLTTTGSKVTPRFKNEPFSFQTNPFKRPRGSALSNMGNPQYQFKEVTKRRQSDLKNKQEKRAILTTNERVTKRCKRGQSTDMETNTLSHHTLCTIGTAEGGHCYICPLGESDLDSDKVRNSRNAGNQDHLQNQTSSDIPRESKSSSLGINETLLTTTKVSSSLPTVILNVKTLLASQTDKGLCGGDEQTQTSKNTTKQCDMEQEEMGTENNMWKLRANRVKQILSGLNKEFGKFYRSKKIGLEFDVGFGPKQNISIDSLTNSVVLELAKFALAINSSQQDFIMEILEHNFDFGLQSQQDRNIFTCEIMKRVRQLRSCEDAVKFSNEVFELSGPMPSIHVANQSVCSVNPELSSELRMEECDVAPMCPPHSHAETTEHSSRKSVDLYPFCKEIGLKLHVNNSLPNKKLDINKLTNGAMTEVTNFAEKLCGTFEEICLDILRHNFDLDLQSGDSELARNILARIPALMEQKNLSTCVKAYKNMKGTRKDFSTMAKLDCQNNPNLDAYGAGSSKTAIIDQNVGRFPDSEHQNELNLKLWKLRTNHIQHILSIPHGEHCPLYSYSRCKKSGIDFNVGSGVKQNLDPKLLTNGIMVELNTFATALQSATKHFVTEILEYNFNLNLKNELDRSAFAQQTMTKIREMNAHKRYSVSRMKMLFELPDTRCIQEPTYDKTTYCPKCYHDRNHKLCQDESDSGHMNHSLRHTMTDIVSADENCTAQKPAKDQSSTFSTTEDTIMDRYPHCKKIGLNLCVDKDQPRDKLDTHVLTREIMNEVASFAKKLCGTKSKIIHAVLEHNFNIGMQSQYVDPAELLRRVKARKDDGLDWFSEVFVIQPISRRQPGYVGKVKREAPMQRSEMKETIKKRKLALQTKEERATLSSHNVSDLKSKTNHRSRGNCYPICTEIGLELDVTSKSVEKEKLDLQLLTRAVVMEIHKFASQKVGHYFPCTVYDILDYNFDLSSQHYRRWEFSIATAFKVQTMVKQYRKKPHGADEVFQLPFVFDPKASKRYVEKRQNKKNANSSLDMASESEPSCLSSCLPFLTSTDISSSSPTVSSNVNPLFAVQPDERGLCGGEEQTQTLTYAPNECDMEEVEMGSENNYTCPLGESDLDSDEVTDSGNAGAEDRSQNTTGSDIPRETESSCLVVCGTFTTTTDVASTLPTVNPNVNPLFASQHDKRGLRGGEEQIQTPRNAPNECDMEEEEIITKNNMWKLRANRVKQILSAQNKEFGRFNRSKKVGLEFNVGFGPNQNISVDSLTNGVLLELAKFALAINSSQQDFIMEILEHNFDLSLQSQQHRNIFTCEIMKRVRQLRSCEDAVKFSNEVFELPGPMPSIHVANQSVCSVNPELSNELRMEECDVAPMCRPHSHADTKEHSSRKSVDLYPFCKEIGLKLHVNNSLPNKKLDINKLTNGAMTEVTNFAEKLCGTFEEICLDILRHNFDLDLQSGDSELARNILARIPALMAQKNLSACIKAYKNMKGTRKDFLTMAKLDCQSNSNLDACGAGSSQAAIIDQNVGSSPESEHQNELNLNLWKLRANHIQHILSIPHGEHCPLYSYSRCKKAGIDFNVGSGVKQNLDPKLLTNGIMVELNTFATALQSATKHFVTEILEYNFNLNLKNELDRSAFAQQTMNKIRSARAHKICSGPRVKMSFTLPDVRFIQEPTTYCPKCYHDRNHKLCQDESDPGHMHHFRRHTMTDTVSADATCTAQKPAKDQSSTFSTTEETIMDSYPRCKKIGLNLCVDKDQPKDKLDTKVLTRGIVNEVANFAKKLCGTKNKILNDVLEHNFTHIMQSRLTISQLFHRTMPLNDAWFSEVFVIQPVSHRQPVDILKRETAMQRSEMKESIKKRKLALQRKEEITTLPSHSISDVKSKANRQSRQNCYPICTEIGLDLDVTSKSAEKEKLDLKLLTRAVVMEIHKFATKKLGHSYPRTVFDILKYNFDLSSQHYRRWEFSIATASKVSNMVKQYHKKIDRADEVFKLPFVFDQKTSQRFVEKRQNNKNANSSLDIASESESSCLSIRVPLLTSAKVSSGLPTVNSNVNPVFASQPDKRGLCAGEEKTQTPGNAPNECDMEQEEMGTENNYTCPLGESDVNSDDVRDSENAGNQDHLQNPKSCSLSSDIRRESESSCLGICVPLLTTTDVSSILPTVTANTTLPLVIQPDKRGLCRGEEQTQTPRNAPNECDMEQEKMGTESLMWKLRANRVKQILSAQNKEFGAFHRSMQFGLEFSVGFGPKQFKSVDSLTNSVLLELAKFALAINSSQQNFIMEILEYNFDFGLQSQHHWNIFACEIMKRVRQLRSCEDAVKFSNEVFELSGPMPSKHISNQSMGSVNPEISNALRMEECDVAPVCPPHSHAETKEHISLNSLDLYPFCKEIGLKLHVNNSLPNKKLDINKLTNGAMSEVTNFAEKLCGTFEEICLDILRHNFDLDLQSGDSELARNILARIPALMEQKNLSACIKAYKKIKGTRKDFSTMAKLDCQNNPNLDVCGAGSSPAAIIDQNAGSFPESEHQNELNLKLWKLRANRIQHILSIPHGEHCPFYAYSRCKKAGIDFNVGSGVKQNLDPKLLTNGIMVELNTFATALQSATKHFVTEILEYNFNLNLKNELDRSAFAEQTMAKIRSARAHKRCSSRRMKMLFELPDTRCIQEPTYDKTTYCPKCYHDRNHKLCQDESDPGHMHHFRRHTMTDTMSADATCTAQKPAKDQSSTFSTTEETIMDSYPRCKKISLNLCVDKDQPKDKLDTKVLTRGIMSEVATFAKKLCGTKNKILNDVLEHNFNDGMQSRDLTISQLFHRTMPLNDAWFSEVFVILPVSHRQPGYVGKVKREAAMQRSEMREAIKQRKLALQTKGERTSDVKSKTNHQSRGNCYPICTEIGLDLDVTSKSAEKEKLDLQLLTRAVVMEIHKFAIKKLGHSYPRTVFDILDYNFDLSSQHYRYWEFSIATASKVSSTYKRYRKNLDGADEVFKLPFVFDPKATQRFVENRENKKSANSSLDIASESESSCLSIRVPLLTSTKVSSCLPTVNSNVNTIFVSQPDKRRLCGGEEQTQTPGNASNECDMEQEEMRTVNDYTCPLGESDLDSDEVTDSENTGNQDHLKNPKGCTLSSDIPRESESSFLGICVPLLTSTNVSSGLPTVNSNVNPLFASQPDKRGLCGGEEQSQTPRNAPNECDMEQEEMGTENNMWRLRANRVKCILSGLNKELGAFHRSKKVGLEFNVGFGPKQNISVDSLTNAVLLELAKFALAINSSQQDFIMEILEHNFDLSLQSQHHRNTLTCEIMKRVRQLRSCEDAVKFSNDVFELPGPMPSIHVANQSVCSVNPELSSELRMEECDVAPVCPPHSETKEHISRRSVVLYPFCKEIGLKLHKHKRNVNNSLPNKKLDISKLTNGAMSEVTNFAEKLCGTFEEICLDVLRHNFDLDLQSGDSELASNILARIPTLMEQRNLSTCVKAYKKIKGTTKTFSTVAKLDYQNNPNLDACGAGSSQAAIIDQNVGSSPESEYQNELNLKLWKLRANHIQHILSIPHGEHCPLYSYSRCKKAGIDFNVGSGVKQNLDPKLLTNGIMVELNTFATALQSATKHFVTEILEYNFNLNLKNELDRSAFAQQTMTKIRLNARKKFSVPRMKMLFELPDTRCIQEPTYDKTTYCPKCYHDRNHKLCQDESDSGPMNHSRRHTMTDTVSADENCTAQKPAKDQSSTFSTTEETIMDSYPRCKKIGLNLCVDKDQPRDKLDTNVLTRAIMTEVASFATKLCGTQSKIINSLLEHNFNIDMQSQDIDPADLFRRVKARKDGGLDWFSEVFVIQPISRRQPGYVGKLRREAAMQISERKETIKKRKLALQTKEERSKLPSHSVSDIKSKRNYRSKGNCYPICTEIGLDLDLTSKSGDKLKLDLQLLTRAVVMEIYKFASQKVGHYFPHTVYDILDYNFDLSSQHCRRLEFSIATASKVQAMVKQYRKTRDRGDKVFKLPFVVAPKASQRFVEKRQNKKREEQDKKTNEGSFVRQVRCYLDANCVHFLDGVKTSEESWFCDEDTKTPTDPGTIVQKNGSLVSVGCGSNPLQGNIDIKEEEYDPHYDDVKPEPDTEEKYHPHYDDVKTESNTEDVEHLVPGGPAGSLRYTFITMCPNSESNIKTESVNEGVKYYILAEPQGSEGHAMLAVCPNTESNIKTGSDIEGVKYLVPVEAAASQGYSITIGQGNESALIKEEQENIPADSYHYGAVSYTEREEGIKQELDP